MGKQVLLVCRILPNFYSYFLVGLILQTLFSCAPQVSGLVVLIKAVGSVEIIIQLP